jgi:hypothetical protein
MPIGIGVEGGPTYQVSRERLSGLTQDEALESLHKIKTQLSQPGRDDGVLTLHNRSNDGSEMTLQRKNGLQLVFQDDRLNDTCVALRTLLQKAGLNEALGQLDEYLSGQEGSKNRIESSRMLEILGLHLQAPQTGTSMEDLCTKAGIETVKELGSGTFGSAKLVTIDGEECVLKEFKHSQTLSLERSGTPNEAMGSYLSSKRDENYLRDKVKVAQPSFYVISMEKDGNREFRMVKPHAMRMLVKQAMRTGSEVQCHGIVMPKANGTEGDKLITEGTLDGLEKKQYIGSMLLSVKGLNERGFVHRDIKPENSYFDRESRTTTLIDTGSLFKTSENQEKHPGSQYIEGGRHTAGTDLYMHPRAARVLEHGLERHGTEADLYAVGISALQVDHPRAIEFLREDILGRNFNQGITPDWLRALLDRRIGEAQPSELKDDLIALRKDIDDPNTLSGFALECFALALEPAESWQDRGVAQQRYSGLLLHQALLG